MDPSGNEIWGEFARLVFSCARAHANALIIQIAALFVEVSVAKDIQLYLYTLHRSIEAAGVLLLLVSL